MSDKYENKELLSSLKKMNKTFSVIKNKGDTKIIEIQTNQEDCISYFTQKSFLEWFQNQFIKIDGKKHNIGRAWLEWEGRKQYEKIVFDPTNEHPVEHFNLWQGYTTRPDKNKKCDLFLNHIFNSVEGNEIHYNFILDWMADLINDPARKKGVCLVFQGTQGTGKGTIAKIFGSLFGRHFLHITDKSRLVGRFTGHLQNALLVFEDEAVWSGDKEAEGRLKAIISEPSLDLEEKFMKSKSVPNYTRLIKATNNDWAAPIEKSNRRYVVFEINEFEQINTPDKKEAYFHAIYHQMYNEGGLSGLLHFLQSRDVSEVNWNNIPRTAATAYQIIENLPLVEKWWFEQLSCEEKWFGKFQPSRSMYKAYQEWEPKHLKSPIQETVFIKTIGDLLPLENKETYQKRCHVGEKDKNNKNPQLMGRDIPDLNSCKKEWNNQYRFEYFKDL